MDPYRSPAAECYPLFDPVHPRLWNELRWLVLALGLALVAGLLTALEVWRETGELALPASDAPLGVLGGIAATLMIGAASAAFYGVFASLAHIGERAEYRRLRRLAWGGELVHAELTTLQFCRDSDGDVQFFLILDLGGGAKAEQRGFYRYHRWMLEPLDAFEPPELPAEDYARVDVALDRGKRFTMQVVVDPRNRADHHVLHDRGLEARAR